MPHLEHFSADAPHDTMLHAIGRDGAIIVDALLDQNALAALRREITPFVEASDNGSDEFSGLLTTRTGGLGHPSRPRGATTEHDLGSVRFYCGKRSDPGRSRKHRLAR